MSLIEKWMGKGRPQKVEIKPVKEKIVEITMIDLPTEMELKSDQKFNTVRVLIESIAISFGGSKGSGRGEHYRVELPKRNVVKNELEGSPFKRVFIPKNEKFGIEKGEMLEIFFQRGTGGHVRIMNSSPEDIEMAQSILSTHLESLKTQKSE